MNNLLKKKIFSKINFENILILYIILQPIIDIITSLCVRNISENLTLGIFIRTIFMIYIMIYTIIKTDKKNKWKILLYYLLIGIYCITFIAVSYGKYEFSMMFTQLKGLIKTFYFPIILSSLLMLLKNKKYFQKQKSLNITLALYVLTIVICKIFSIGYATYPHNNKAGTIGLFYAGNEISAIIALLSPICFGTFISQKFNILSAVLCALTIFAMLEIGTKVACISIICLVILSLIVSLIKLIKREQKGFYKQFITLLLIGFLTTSFISYTSGGINLKIQPIFKSQNSSTEISEAQQGSTTNNSASDSTALLSGRNKFFKKTLKKYNESSITDKFIGMGYISPKSNAIQESKLVEIDYFDIFFCHGILGTLIYITPLFLLIVLLIKKFFACFINNIKNHTLIFKIYSALIGFGIALMAGHVFTAPAVSMFLILILLEMFSELYYEKDLKNE